ncbi:MAG: hypothetical protein ACI856_002780 [Kiritimatiellia bacterium]|jgi:hypothetical protein
MLERLTLFLLFRLESGGPRRQQWLSLCVPCLRMDKFTSRNARLRDLL